MPIPRLRHHSPFLGPLLASALAGCASTPPRPALPSSACCAPVAASIAERWRVPAITTRRFTHAELWQAVDSTLRSPALRTTEIGRSLHGRPIRAITFGRGPTRVLLWSQMHGDESTATMSLADILRFFAGTERDALRERIHDALTVVMVPMLNPDGAELFQRENAAGVDVNRDARALVTPEARALKALRDSLHPQFGFNLHDQSARTLAGQDGDQVAIALLAPAAEASRAYDATRTRARLVAAVIATALADALPGRLAKYDDTFNARAFGDLMQQWGTSTVLIESGAIADDPEKQRLRAHNVVAILTALDAIATGSYEGADPARYERLPFNARITNDVIVRGAQVVLPGGVPLRLDIALVYDDPVARTGPRVREVGDLEGATALDTLDAAGLYLHPAAAMLHELDGRRWLRLGEPAAFTLRRGAEAASAAVREVR